MTRPTLSIIIINYNTPELVYQCLKSIKKYVKTSYEVILVENGSKEEYRIQKSEVSKIFTDTCNFQLLTLKTNVGFGGGNNFGAKQAKGEYLWFLNSDTKLVEDAPSLMINFLKIHPEIGALLPILYHDDGSIQGNLYANFQTLGSITIRRFNFTKRELFENNSKDFFYVDVVVGAAMMMKRKIFEKVGGFDQNIFMYLEDDDICKRIEQEGYKNAVLKSTKIIHLEGRSIKNNRARKKLYYLSQTYFWNKHNGFWPTLLMRIIRWPYKLVKTNLK